MKKILAFDIDKTLNLPKMPISQEMAGVLTDILRYYEVCVISGQRFEQFLVQVIEPMGSVAPELLEKMHLMVAQGTQYYRYENGEWALKYNEALNEKQAEKISDALEKAAREVGYWVDLDNGDEIIENRISMIAYSALGQKAVLEDKQSWDADMKKRNAIAARAKELAPEFDFEVGGTTTINAFLPGMNKMFGMTKLMEISGAGLDDILYFGDMTQPGGNDYPVVQMGIETITVRSWEDTWFALQGVLGVN